MKAILSKVQNIIKWGVLTLCGEDIGNYPKSQVSYMDKTKDVVMFSPYGLYSNAPEDSLVVLMNAQAQEENMIGMAFTPNIRIKPMKRGEVAIANVLTGSVFYFDLAGNVNAVVTKDLNMVVTGNVNITAANVVVTAPMTTIDGELTVTADITCLGNVNCSDAIVNSKAVDGHVHPDPQGGSTGAF